MRNLKLRKFILNVFWSIIRKFAPTKVSRYTVMFDNQQTWNSTPNILLSWFLVFSKHIRSSTCSLKKILLADRSHNHALYCCKSNLATAAASWYELVCDANGRARSNVFLFGGGGKSYVLFYKCIFRRDFLTSRTAIVSCPIPALAYLVAVMIWQWYHRALRPLKSALREYIGNKFSPLWLVDVYIMQLCTELQILLACLHTQLVAPT